MLSKADLEKNIIELLGIQALPDDKKIALLKKTTDLVQQRVFMRLMEHLPEEQREAFIEAAAGQDEAAIEKIFEGKGDIAPQLIEEEVIRVKQELAGVINQAS